MPCLKFSVSKQLSIIGNFESIKRFDIDINVSNIDTKLHIDVPIKFLLFWAQDRRSFHGTTIGLDDNKLQPSGSTQMTMR
jgi:hypothetical protein